jgi:hypothetical protein
LLGARIQSHSTATAKTIAAMRKIKRRRLATAPLGKTSATDRDLQFAKKT